MRIILPQVIKIILPSITNETITLVKDTSLAFTIGIMEMFTISKEMCIRDSHMTERMKEEMKKIIPLSQIYLNEVV